MTGLRLLRLFTKRMPESAGSNLVRLASRAALAATGTAEAAAQAEDALAVAPQPSGEQQLATTTATRRTLAARCGRFACGSPGSSGSQAHAPHERRDKATDKASVAAAAAVRLNSAAVARRTAVYIIPAALSVSL